MKPANQQIIYAGRMASSLAIGGGMNQSNPEWKEIDLSAINLFEFRDWFKPPIPPLAIKFSIWSQSNET